MVKYSCGESKVETRSFKSKQPETTATTALALLPEDVLAVVKGFLDHMSLVSASFAGFLQHSIHLEPLVSKLEVLQVLRARCSRLKRLVVTDPPNNNNA